MTSVYTDVVTQSWDLVTFEKTDLSDIKRHTYFLCLCLFTEGVRSSEQGGCTLIKQICLTNLEGRGS